MRLEHDADGDDVVPRREEEEDRLGQGHRMHKRYVTRWHMKMVKPPVDCGMGSSGSWLANTVATYLTAKATWQNVPNLSQQEVFTVLIRLLVGIAQTRCVQNDLL